MATTLATPRLGDIEQGIISPCHSEATAVETFSSCGESCTADNDEHNNTRSSSASFSSSCSCYLSECSVEDIESGRDNGGAQVAAVEIGKVSVHLTKVKRDCRICYLSFDGSDLESGLPIELGCSCKEDLAAAHKHCAEAWFKIRGNKIL
ncbi:uncharacterized protein LOC141643045 isoform X2 [Silene latifolia]|uniref:uncharacterized protein LOC141643045 isoform X2 n=1 Tax=Silene latifolia TaxID=37657 RepID=UPI003D774B74